MLWLNTLRVPRNACGAAAIFVFVASTAAGQTIAVDTPGVDRGSLVNGKLPVAIGDHTITDSGAAISTSGGNLCLLNAACVFSGSVDTFGKIQFTGASSGSGQDINDLKGASWAFSGTPWAAQYWEVAAGTSSSQVTTAGSVVKISKFQSMNDSVCNNNPVLEACSAALVVGATGDASDDEQVVAGFFGAQGQTTVCSNCNTVAVTAHAQTKGMGVELASAAFFIAENRSGFTTTGSGCASTCTGSGSKGFELDDDNESGFPCPPVSYTGAGVCPGGIWMSSGGPNNVGPAIHLANGLGTGGTPWDEGITVNQSAVTNITFNDQSSSAASLNIAGTHATAAINVGSGAGNVYLNGNALSTCGAVSPCSSGSVSTGLLILPAAGSSPTIVAGADTTSGFFQSATGIWKYASAGANTIQFGNGLVLGSPTGGDKGVGTLNLGAGGLYDNGTAPTGTGPYVHAGTPTLTSPISNTLELTAAAPIVSASQIGYGSTTSAASNCNSGGTTSPVGCIVINIGGTNHNVPYF